MAISDNEFQTLRDRVTVIEQRLGIPAPAPDPTPATPVRADTLAAVRAAINAGARHLQTTGIELGVGEDLDSKGALIELLPGGPSWKPAVALVHSGALRNATIRTPLSTYNTAGQRTAFWKAIEVRGNATIQNVSIHPDAGYCLHVMSGRLLLVDFSATTFSEYFVYQEPGTHVEALRPIFRGGSRAESGWRVNAATYEISDAIFDNSAGGKAALRGDSPPLADGSPGGIIRRSRIVGQYGPNPLTEDDGGQMLGIDRWRIDGKWVFQLHHTKKTEAIAYAQSLRQQGRGPREIARACADRFIPPADLRAYAGRDRVSDRDLDLTMDLRRREIGRTSYARIEESEIVGDFRINARAVVEIVDTTLRGNPPLAGNSQRTYPFPVDRVLGADEPRPPAQVTISGCQIVHGPAGLGLDLSKWARLINTTITAESTS